MAKKADVVEGVAYRVFNDKAALIAQVDTAEEADTLAHEVNGFYNEVTL